VYRTNRRIPVNRGSPIARKLLATDKLEFVAEFRVERSAAIPQSEKMAAPNSAVGGRSHDVVVIGYNFHHLKALLA
jgi:hypothetical protein